MKDRLNCADTGKCIGPNFYHWPKTWADFWEAKSLSQQFALMSSVVLPGG
jgi:hypothetical protein